MLYRQLLDPWNSAPPTIEFWLQESFSKGLCLVATFSWPDKYNIDTGINQLCFFFWCTQVSFQFILCRCPQLPPTPFQKVGTWLGVIWRGAVSWLVEMVPIFKPAKQPFMKWLVGKASVSCVNFFCFESLVHWREKFQDWRNTILYIYRQSHSQIVLWGVRLIFEMFKIWKFEI